jgi:hypothetical protein
VRLLEVGDDVGEVTLRAAYARSISSGDMTLVFMGRIPMGDVGD